MINQLNGTKIMNLVSIETKQFQSDDYSVSCIKVKMMIQCLVSLSLYYNDNIKIRQLKPTIKMSSNEHFKWQIKG